MSITSTFSLAPEPFWTIINKAGTVAGGAKMYTRSSKNPNLEKIVYQNSGGTTPWDNPIIFGLNGVQGPFYWEFDSALPDELYYIRVTDADDNPLWDINGFSPGLGGGGGDITNYVSIQNYITNNVFIDHIDDTAGTTNLVIAPSNHKGFTPSDVNPISATYGGVVGSDTRFVKNTTAATDQITFPLFPMADSPFDPDVTPVDYVRYLCTVNPGGETYKCFQFPITQKVKNLAGQQMTFNIWAKVAVTPVILDLFSLQYFGSGTSASASVREPLDTITLTTTWTSYRISLVIPDVAGKSLGTAGKQTGDDALYIQLGMPLGMTCDVWFTKPSLYLGDVDPDASFDSYDQINSINSTPRTGDIKTSLLSSAPKGWVAMNDLSIGNALSGATNRANQDTFQLYKTIWDSVYNNTWAPVSGGYGATAVADFVAGKTLTLPRSLGRALAGAGSGSGLTPRVLGEYAGAETISIAAMPSHNHPGSTVALGRVAGSAAGVANTVPTAGPTAVTVASQGGGAADGNMEPTSFFNVFIKL